MGFLNHQLYVYKNRWSLCVCKFKSQILATAQNNVMSDHFEGLDLKVCCCVLKGVRAFANHIGICLRHSVSIAYIYIYIYIYIYYIYIYSCIQVHRLGYVVCINAHMVPVHL